MPVPEERMTKAEIARLGRLAKRDRALEMQSKGASFSAVAKELDMSESSARRLIESAGKKPEDQPMS